MSKNQKESIFRSFKKSYLFCIFRHTVPAVSGVGYTVHTVPAGVPVEDDSQQGRLCPTPAMTSALHGRYFTAVY